ncbi:TPA: AAA family ATPase, partial [Escherichia coli]|nr:AAA family ATPase [Escherichia coli]
DIDRLTPTETFQVLRLVKAVADFSGTSFLLAFDPNYLISVLDKNNIVNSSEYLNKIVQLRVPLPVISERGMNELANAELEKIANKSLTDRFESDQERLSWIYHNYFKKLIKNPRELKRFFNHLRFVLEQIEGQVCFSDLFALSLVATKSSLVYEHIKSTPEAYIGKRFTNDGLLMDKPQDIVDRFSDERNKKLSNFSDQERSVMQELLGDIFPLLQSSGYSHYGVSDPDTAGRVSAPQRLHIAFHYKTPAGYISDHDIISFINGDVKRNEFLRDVLSQNAEERFFEMMNNYSSYCKDNSFEILTCIYDTFLFSQELKSSLERNYGFLTKDLYRRMNWLTNKVISESDDKYGLIKGVVGRHENAPLGADVLCQARKQIQNGWNDKIWVSIEELAELEGIFQQVAIKVLSDKIYFDYHLESHVFFELKRVSSQFTSEFIASVLSSDGLIRMCEIIGETGSDSTNGPFFKFDEIYFGEILDVNELRNKAKNLDFSIYPTRIQAVLKSILDGQKYYLRDATVGEDW